MEEVEKNVREVMGSGDRRQSLGKNGPPSVRGPKLSESCTATL
jgi:hypothetical protein